MDKEEAIDMAIALKNFCWNQHWRCCDCPFYLHIGGNCKLYGFPHTWLSLNLEQVSKGRRNDERIQRTY